MEGYAIKTAGEGIDPKRWTIQIDQIDLETGERKEYNKMISEKKNFDGSQLSIETFSHEFEKIYLTDRIILKVKECVNDFGECQIGEFQILSKDIPEKQQIKIKIADEINKI